MAIPGYASALASRPLARLLRGVVIGVLGGAITGCSLQPPVITVGEARLVEASDEALRLDVALELENFNDEPIELKQFNYTVAIDGRRLYTGRRAAGATLSAEGRTALVLPAIVPFQATGWTAEERPDTTEWSISGSVLYLTPGALAEILLDTRFREPRAPFRGGGAVAIR